MALNQSYGGEENKGKARNLGNSKSDEHEAVRPEAFNPKSTDGIEHEIGKKYIAPDYDSSPPDPQEEEEDTKIPEGLIQEGRVKVGVLNVVKRSMRLIDENSPRQVCWSSKGLLVKEVTPTPNSLAENETRGTDIGNLPEGKPFQAGID